MIKIAKYEFLDQEQAETKINDLGTATDENGNEYPTHKHTIVQLGNIVLQQGTYDEDGNELTAPVLSDKWHVDVLFNGLDDHPQGWESYAIDSSGDGVHSFLGLSYNAHKF
jgi:hypothetical protein